ncbi:uncharacterized protein METZ01_LOCUS443150, partial [marine metagenome]
MGGVFAQVAHLMGIPGKIEKLVTIDVWIVDQLVALVPYHPLLVAKVTVYLGIYRILFAGDDRFQAFALDAFGDGDAGKVANRGVEVPQVAQSVGSLACGYLRPGYDQRDSDCVLVHVLFAHQSMAAQGQSMVAREDDVGVFQPPVGSQLPDDSAPLLVDMIDH